MHHGLGWSTFIKPVQRVDQQIKEWAVLALLVGETIEQFNNVGPIRNQFQISTQVLISALRFRLRDHIQVAPLCKHQLHA